MEKNNINNMDNIISTYTDTDTDTGTPKPSYKCSSQSVTQSSQPHLMTIGSILQGNIDIAKILHPKECYLSHLQYAYEWSIDDIFYTFHNLVQYARECYVDRVKINEEV